MALAQFFSSSVVTELNPTENDLCNSLIFPRMEQTSTIPGIYTIEASGHQELVCSQNHSWEELKSQTGLKETPTSTS